jgi:hypothetical protein
MNNQTLILIFSLVLATMGAHGASLGPATILAGAARLNSGSIVSIGQSVVGTFGGAGGMSGVAGIVPCLSSGLLFPPERPLISGPHHLSGRVSFRFTSQPGLNYVIEASMNLTDWTPVQTFRATQPTSSFEDTNSGEFQRRFFRVRSL